MTREEVVKEFETILEKLKDNGVPEGMTDETYFDIVVEVEDIIEKAKENGEE